MPEHPDLQRLRSEYERRSNDAAGNDLYSHQNPGQLYAIQQRQRAVLRCFRKNGFHAFEYARILELGCGTGGVLLEMLSTGAALGRLHGTDLIFDRVTAAHGRVASLQLTCADGQALPYPANSFDLSMQFTVFSSILAQDIRVNMARELLRVTRPGGMILWYDFWINPFNPQTRGIRPGEIRNLFPECRIDFERITLAPPLARRLAKFSWGLCLFLESLKIFNTHFLAAIHPEGEQTILDN